MIRKYQRRKMSFLKEMALYQDMVNGGFITHKGTSKGTSAAIKLGDKIYNYVMNRCSDDAFEKAFGGELKSRSDSMQRSYFAFSKLLCDLGILENAYHAWGPKKISPINIRTVRSKIKILNNFFDTFDPSSPVEIVFNALENGPEEIQKKCLGFSPFYALDKVRGSNSEERWNNLLGPDPNVPNSKEYGFIAKCLTPYVVLVAGNEEQRNAGVRKSYKDTLKHLASYSDYITKKADAALDADNFDDSQRDTINAIKNANSRYLSKADKEAKISAIRQNSGIDFDDEGEYSKTEQMSTNEQVKIINKAAERLHGIFSAAYKTGISFAKYYNRLKTVASMNRILKEKIMEDISEMLYAYGEKVENGIEDTGDVQNLKDILISKLEQFEAEAPEKKHTKNIIEDGLKEFFENMQRESGLKVIKPIDFFEYQLEHDPGFIYGIELYGLSEDDLTEKKFPTWKTFMDYMLSEENIRIAYQTLGVKERAKTQLAAQNVGINKRKQKGKARAKKLLLLQAELNGQTSITIEKPNGDVEEIPVNGGIVNPCARMDDEEYFAEKKNELDNIREEIEELKNQPNSFDKISKLATDRDRIIRILKTKKRDNRERYIIPEIEKVKNEISETDTELLHLYDDIMQSASEENITAFALKGVRDALFNKIHADDYNIDTTSEEEIYCIVFKVKCDPKKLEQIEAFYCQEFKKIEIALLKQAKIPIGNIHQKIQSDSFEPADGYNPKIKLFWNTIYLSFKETAAIYEYGKEDVRKTKNLVKKIANNLNKQTQQNLVEVDPDNIRVNVKETSIIQYN